jgi:hypothetical protein
MLFRLSPVDKNHRQHGATCDDLLNRVFEKRKSVTFLMKKGSFWEHEHILSMDH